MGRDRIEQAETEPALLRSRPCTQEQLETDRYRQWCARIGETPRLHRKQWEFCYIAQALYERGMLEPGKRGLGFGVGQEPLPALFASLGCAIVATDQVADNAQAAGWTDTAQYASGIAELNARGLCDPATFERLVAYRVVDMNRIPSSLSGFDFLWSSCALEHLGSIRKGQAFVLRAMACLRPGGVAVHTTEFNVSSDRETLDRAGTVLFRKRDVRVLAEKLARRGHSIELDFDTGQGLADDYIDLPPYRPDPHLKLKIGDYVSTSYGLIIHKAESGGDATCARLIRYAHDVVLGWKERLHGTERVS